MSDDDDFFRFRARPRNASRRETISRHVDRVDLGLETSAGPVRLYVTSKIVIEVDLDSCLPTASPSEPAPRQLARLPKRTRR